MTSTWSGLQPRKEWGRDEAPGPERRRGLAKFLGEPRKDEDVEVLTTHQVAEMLQVDENTVRHWLKTNQLEGFRLPAARSGWRIQKSAVRKFVTHLVRTSHQRPGWEQDEEEEGETPTI